MKDKWEKGYVFVRIITNDNEKWVKFNDYVRFNGLFYKKEYKKYKPVMKKIDGNLCMKLTDFNKLLIGKRFDTAINADNYNEMTEYISEFIINYYNNKK